jgi:type IX secretion system PorP/SprF family membrane protein
LLNQSPAFTGFFNGDYRVNAIYRSQWLSVPVPYSTFSMGGEMRVKPFVNKKEMIGVGVTFNNDKAGDANYGTNQFYFSGSYIIPLKADSSLLLSTGLNFGICQVGFDYSKMTFDNQFDGANYNKNLTTGERFNYTNYTFVDFNVGAGLQYILNSKHKFMYGLGLHHLTNPVITYQGNRLSKLDFKLSNYIQYTTPISLKVDIIAEALINNQGKYYEIIPHTSLKYYFNKDLNQAVLGGISLRARDAFVLRAGYHFKTMQSGIAYDINTSKFIAATNRRGAFELYINYIIQTKRSYTAKKRACPVFM